MAVRAITLLIPKLILKAAKKPKRYAPVLSAKIKMVMVPGQGITPALKTTPQSVLWDFGEHDEHLHVKGCAENETIFGARFIA